MIAQSDVIISEKHLFPMIEKMLKNGKSVRFNVSGNSMWPMLIRNLDSVLLEPCNIRLLKKGDIILFQTSGGHHVLHRITQVKKGGYITTGDGNLHRDGFVPEENVIAKVNQIYRKEKVIDCENWYWKLVFKLWMAAYPIRWHLMSIINWIKIK